MSISLWSFEKVRALEGIQRWRWYDAKPELPAEALSCVYAGWRQAAHLDVFNVTVTHLSPTFIQSFVPPASASDAAAYANANGFSILNQDGEPMLDWFWWSAMIGSCVAGGPGKTTDAIEATLMRRLEEKLSREAWFAPNLKRSGDT